MGPLQHYIGLWDGSHIARSDNKEWIKRMSFINETFRSNLGFMTLNEIDILSHLATKIVIKIKSSDEKKVAKDTFKRFIEKYKGMKLIYVDPGSIGNGHRTLISQEFYDVLQESDTKRNSSDAYTHILRQFEILKKEMERIYLYQAREENKNRGAGKRWEPQYE